MNIDCTPSWRSSVILAACALGVAAATATANAATTTTAAAASAAAATAAAAAKEPAASAGAGAPIALERLWVTEGFADPEGVAAAPNGHYFVSNVAGEGTAMDGEGWVSIIAADGDTVAAQWVRGLDAPKGMVLAGSILYVADVTRVRRFEIATGKALDPLPAPGAGFLNDMTQWNEQVYVSDSAGARIYRLEGDAFEVWAEDAARLAGVNGLLADGDRLLVSTMRAGSLLAVDEEGRWQEIASGMINADGIGLVPGDGYLVSSWPGQIHFVSDAGNVSTLVDTRDAGTYQNDLSVFDDLAIVPNWQPGTVTAWRIVR